MNEPTFRFDSLISQPASWLYGIWDVYVVAKPPCELALDDRGAFSYATLDCSHIAWGSWSVLQPASFALTCSGQFGSIVQKTETWTMARAADGRVTFPNGAFMTLRSPGAVAAAGRISLLETLGVGLNELDLMTRQMDDRVRPLFARLDTLRGQLWVDTTPLHREIYGHYQDFLSRLGPLESFANQLKSAGQPQLLTSLERRRDDVSKAMTIGGQILASHGQYASQATQVTINMQKEWWEHQQRMRELSLKVTESINRVKP